MSRETIGSVAIELMKKEDIQEIDIGHLGLLGSIFLECKKRNVIKNTKMANHPMNRNQYIISQLKKSKLFEKAGYINYPGIVNARCSVLKIKEDE